MHARGFDSFMDRPLVCYKTGLSSCVMVTLSARVFDSFMYCPLVPSKVRLCSCLIVALSARVSDSIMYNLLMCCQIVLVWYLMTTDITTVLFIVRIVIALYSHNSVRCSLILEICNMLILSLVMMNWLYNHVLRHNGDHRDIDQL